MATTTENLGLKNPSYEEMADIGVINDNMEIIDKAYGGLKGDLGNILSPNLYNPTDAKENTAISNADGIEMAFDGWIATGYIPVSKGEVLYFSSNNEPTYYSTGAFYDSQKKFISGFGNPNNINNNITVTSDGYARFSFESKREKLQIEKGSRTTYIPYGDLKIRAEVSEVKAEVVKILPKWKGLKILTLGDSITAMGGVNGWTYWIKQYLLADKVVNVSVAGATWQDKVANQTYDGNPQPSTDGNVMGNQVQKVLNAKANGEQDYQDFDVITLSFGTNDYVDLSVQTKESVENQFVTNYTQNNFTVVPIENVNRQTLAGAIRYGFQKLHEAYPKAVIFICTPTQECYETFDSIYKKGELINYIADRCGAETIDTRRCGIRNIYESQTSIDYDHPEQSGTAPIQTDLLDGIHTNENGAKKIAKYNAREIMKYFMIN